MHPPVRVRSVRFLSHTANHSLYKSVLFREVTFFKLISGFVSGNKCFFFWIEFSSLLYIVPQNVLQHTRPNCCLLLTGITWCLLPFNFQAILSREAILAKEWLINNSHTFNKCDITTFSYSSWHNYRLCCTFCISCAAIYHLYIHIYLWSADALSPLITRRLFSTSRLCKRILIGDAVRCVSESLMLLLVRRRPIYHTISISDDAEWALIIPTRKVK